MTTAPVRVVFRMRDSISTLRDSPPKSKLVQLLLFRKKQNKEANMRTLIVSIVGMLLFGCGGEDENICAAARQHVASCIPERQAVDNPSCDASAEDFAHLVLDMDCSQIQALTKEGKASWWGCGWLWRCDNDGWSEHPTSSGHVYNHSPWGTYSSCRCSTYSCSGNSNGCCPVSTCCTRYPNDSTKCPYAAWH